MRVGGSYDGTQRLRFFLAATFFAMVLLCLVQGCAGHMRDVPFPPDAPRLDSGVWSFRHKVRLEMPERGVTQSFDGVMRLDLAAKTIHAAGVAGIGMQLFDIVVTPERAEVRYLHPVLRKIPYATEHIALCLRRIWFDCLVIIPQTTPLAGAGWRFSASGNGRDAYWPDTARFSNLRDGYTITVRLLRAQREDTS